MNDYEIWFALSKLNYNIKNILINSFSSVEELWYYSLHDEENEIMNDKIKSSLREAWDKDKIKYIKNKLLENSVNTVVITDRNYPERLKYYEDSPYMLFYRGNIEKLNSKYNVSIVGSRNCTSYGVNVTNIICEQLCNNDINIISGMAKGIDSVAHLSCIKNGSYNCAIMGSGIDVIYPRENKDIYGNILKNGCIVSQFLPGTQPLAFNFPVRNRIISALCDVLLVVEAGIKSGSLITAGAALEQGKDVIVVPGSVFSNESKGTNKLIKDGAHVFTETNDIFNLLNIKNITKLQTNKKELQDTEKLVYSHMTDNPIHLDDVFRLTNIDIKQLYEVLFELQLKNEIISLSGNYYVRNNKQI